MSSNNPRPASAESRRFGRHFHNRYQMKPIRYKVEVSHAFAGDQWVILCECWDLSLVSVVYSHVSMALLLPKTRLALTYGNRVLPSDENDQACSHFFSFERRPKVTCIILPPANCIVCGRQWVRSEARRLWALHWVQECKPDCRCEMNFENREYGWRGARLWNRLVYALKIKQMSLFHSRVVGVPSQLV